MIAVGAVLAVVVAVPPPPAACAAITNPAPCGQANDGQAKCEARGCCWLDGAKSYLGPTPCFYAGGNLINVTTVHVVQVRFCIFSIPESRYAPNPAAV